MGVRQLTGFPHGAERCAGFHLFANAAQELAGLPVNGHQVAVMLHPERAAFPLVPFRRDDGPVEDGRELCPGRCRDFDVGVAATRAETFSQRTLDRAFERDVTQGFDPFGFGAGLLSGIELLHLYPQQRVAGFIPSQLFGIDLRFDPGQAHRVERQRLASRHDPLDIGYLEGPQVDDPFQ